MIDNQIDSQDRRLIGAGTLFFIMMALSAIAVSWYFFPHPFIGLAIALIPLALLFTVRMLFWFMLLFVVFSFFRIHEVFPFLIPLKLPLLFSLGALSSICWHLFISRSLNVYWHPSMTWLLLFWIVVVSSIVFASNRGVAITSFQSIYWKIMVMTLAIIWIVTDKKYLAKTCWVIIISGALVSMVALYNTTMGIGLVEGSRVTIGRAIGSVLGDPNDLALVLLFPMGFSVSVILSSHISVQWRILATITTLCLTLAIIATQSRGGLLGMLTVYAYFCSQVIRSKLVLVALGVLGAALLYAAAGISGRASGGAAEVGIDASAMGRLYAWEAAAKMALDNPLFGVGLDNFYFNYFYYSAHWDGLNHAVHSTWFGVLAETGFLGLFLFVGLIISLLKAAHSTIVKLNTTLGPPPEDTHSNQHGYLLTCAKAVFAGLLGTIVSGTFLTQGFVWPIYILAALTVSVSKIAQN